VSDHTDDRVDVELDEVVFDGEIIEAEESGIAIVDREGEGGGEDDDDADLDVLDVLDATEVDDDGVPIVDDLVPASVAPGAAPGVSSGAAAESGADESVMVLDNWQFELPATGDDKVDTALAHLVGIEGLPPAEHVAVDEAVHRGLQDALADLDRG